MTFDKKKKQIQLIHVAKSQLQLEDELYREILESTTGKTSTTQMTIAQLEAVLDRFKQLGFTVESKNKSGVNNLASDDQSRLIRHLWLLLYNAGEVRNSSELALVAFVEKQAGVSALQFLSTDSASRVIERLKKWCNRKGVEITRPQSR
ncbi:gp16 family protein [Acinetobacter puyangensis]|uniref:gp16 family protein n=1 Tax=Acinetobacter puyangensis TaxID=1096779 RepID=UPI003A4DA5B7